MAPVLSKDAPDIEVRTARWLPGAGAGPRGGSRGWGPGRPSAAPCAAGGAGAAGTWPPREVCVAAEESWEWSGCPWSGTGRGKVGKPVLTPVPWLKGHQSCTDRGALQARGAPFRQAPRSSSSPPPAPGTPARCPQPAGSAAEGSEAQGLQEGSWESSCGRAGLGDSSASLSLNRARTPALSPVNSLCSLLLSVKMSSLFLNVKSHLRWPFPVRSPGTPVSAGRLTHCE